MIEREEIRYIEGTPVAVRACSIERYVPHYHEDCLELMFVLKGTALVRASYDRFDMEAGDFVLINNGDVHYIRGSADNIIISIYLDLNRLKQDYEHFEYLYFICESFNANSMQEAYLQEIRRIIVSIVTEAADRNRDADKITAEVRKLIDILIYKFDLVHYHNGRDISETQLERYHRIVMEVEKRYSEKLELEDIAQKEFIGRNYISQFWKNMTNMNFTEYLNSRRSEMAERMLLATDKSINEISLVCGFSDPKYIYKNFRKWYEKTPSEYKKEYERYKAEGTELAEYDGAEFLGRFGKEFIYASVDKEKASIIRSAETPMSWRRKYEYHVQKSTGSKLKREMVRESHLETGLKEIVLPLLDSDETAADADFIDKVLDSARTMGLALTVEINFAKRDCDSWERVIREFAGRARDALSRCRFNIYIDDFEKDVQAKQLTDKISDIINPKNIKMAVKFD